MSPSRPDLVDCWIYRPTPRGLEILLIRRAPGRILAGLWQCVSGSLEPGERVAAGALRELREETGFDDSTIERFFDLDLVNQFHEPSVDAVSKAIDDPVIRARFVELGSTVPQGANRGPAALQALLEREMAMIVPVLKAAGAKGE